MKRLCLTICTVLLGVVILSGCQKAEEPKADSSSTATAGKSGSSVGTAPTAGMRPGYTGPDPNSVIGSKSK